jgi:hypothetical protein
VFEIPSDGSVGVVPHVRKNRTDTEDESNMAYKNTSGRQPSSSGPHHSLDEVKRLVASGQFMLMKGRALNLLVPPLTYAEALRFVAAAVQLLSVDNFHQSVQLTHDVADEYGLNIDGTGWYIKLCIDQSEPEVTVISFHTPQFPMRTKAGTIKPP